MLLCAPFGQEPIPEHRFYRVLADRLAGNGFDVLRFDCFGTGDSSGDDEDFDLVGAVTETQFLCEWGRRLLHPARVSLMGLRLGADIVMLASARTGGTVAELILIEPVIEGAAYGEHMRQTQRRHIDWRLATLLPDGVEGGRVR